MASRAAPASRHRGRTAPTPRPASLHFRTVAAVTGAAFAMQAFVWMTLWQVFGISRMGYWFFELSDIAYYYEAFIVRMAQGLVPFRDFFLEYPPLFVPLLAAPGVAVSEWQYVVRFALLMMAFMGASCAATSLAALDGKSTWRPYVVASTFTLYTLLLGPIAANRYDPAVALTLALILLFMARSRWLTVAVLIGVGFALKVTPAMLLPLALLLAGRKRLLPMLAGFAVAAAVPFAIVTAIGGSAGSNLVQMIGYHLSRPLEIESVLATPFWIGRLAGAAAVPVGLAAGSQVVLSQAANSVASLSSVILLLALGGVFALVWRRRDAIASDTSLQFLAVLATLLASLVGSKVLSPQYFVWVIPAVALVAVDRRVLGILLAAVLLLTHIEFPANYWSFAQFQIPGAIAIVVVRNVILVAAFGLSLWHLWTIAEVPPRTAKARH